MTKAEFLRTNRRLLLGTGLLGAYLLSLFVFGPWSVPTTVVWPQYDRLVGPQAFAFVKTPYPAGYDFAGVTVTCVACILLVLVPLMLVFPFLLRTVLARFLDRNAPRPTA